MASPNSEVAFSYTYRGLRFPTLGAVLALHEKAVTEAPGQPGVRDRGNLESAVHMPLQSVGGDDAYPGLFSKISALGWNLAAKQGFIDGNKRTALLVTQTALKLNG